MEEFSSLEVWMEQVTSVTYRPLTESGGHLNYVIKCEKKKSSFTRARKAHDLLWNDLSEELSLAQNIPQHPNILLPEKLVEFSMWEEGDSTEIGLISPHFPGEVPYVYLARQLHRLRISEGRELSECLRETERLLWEVCRQAAQALVHVHACHVAHLDCVAHNFLVADSAGPGTPAVKLIDFSLAHTTDTAGRLTVKCGPGRLRNLSPEEATACQTKTATSVDAHKCDVWRFGMTLFTLLYQHAKVYTMKPTVYSPFVSSREQSCSNIPVVDFYATYPRVQKTLSRIEEFCGRLDDHVDGLLLGVFEVDPHERFNMSQVLTAIETILAARSSTRPSNVPAMPSAGGNLQSPREDQGGTTAVQASAWGAPSGTGAGQFQQATSKGAQRGQEAMPQPPSPAQPAHHTLVSVADSVQWCVIVGAKLGVAVTPDPRRPGHVLLGGAGMAWGPLRAVDLQARTVAALAGKVPWRTVALLFGRQNSADSWGYDAATGRMVAGLALWVGELQLLPEFFHGPDLATALACAEASLPLGGPLAVPHVPDLRPGCLLGRPSDAVWLDVDTLQLGPGVLGFHGGVGACSNPLQHCAFEMHLAAPLRLSLPAATLTPHVWALAWTLLSRAGRRELEFWQRCNEGLCGHIQAQGGLGLGGGPLPLEGGLPPGLAGPLGALLGACQAALAAGPFVSTAVALAMLPALSHDATITTQHYQPTEVPFSMRPCLAAGPGDSPRLLLRLWGVRVALHTGPTGHSLCLLPKMEIEGLQL